MKKTAIIFLVILFAVTLVSCGGEKKAEENKNISIAHTDWAGTLAMTHLAKEILESRLGYNVTLSQNDVNHIYSSLARGENDFFMGAWLPNTHERFMYHYDYKIRKVGKNYGGARTGLAVPSYVSINSIEELPENADKFGGKITGIEDGAGIINNTEEALRVYQFKMGINTSSEAQMLSQLDNAVRNNQWIVVTAWNPHWMVKKYNLKFLEDPKNIFGTIESINTVSRKNLSQTNPVLYKFLRKFTLDRDQMGDLLAEMQANQGNPAQAAKNFMSDNVKLVDTWIPKD